jgi:hypothetical protein
MFPVEKAPPNNSVFGDILCVSDISFRVRLHSQNGAGPFKEGAIFLDLNDCPDWTILMIPYTITIQNDFHDTELL